jgi:hypothetical protein
MDTEEIVGLGEMLGLRSQRPLPTVRDTSLVALSRRTPTTGGRVAGNGDPVTGRKAECR